MTVTADPAKWGQFRWGQAKWGRNRPTVDRPNDYRVEIRSAAGGATLLATTKYLLDGSLDLKANACGVVTIDFAQNDAVWPFIVYGNEVWVYAPGCDTPQIFIIRSTGRSH